MSTSQNTSLSERSSILRFLRWLFTWRALRGILLVLAWAVTLVALLYGAENWRGYHAWSRYRRDLESRGEQLEFKAFFPKKVPDEQNFGATPTALTWFERGTFADNNRRWEDDYGRASTEFRSKQDSGSRHFMDLVGWQQAMAAVHAGEVEKGATFDTDQLDLESRAKAAPGVLEALRANQALFDELRAASRRPYAIYPVKYDIECPPAILLPHLANVKAVCLRLELKACAELASGRGDDALQDVELMLYMADTLKDEPILVSQMVRAACVHLAIQPVWEGLAERRWTAPQLQALQSRLLPYNFLADLRRVLDAERAGMLATIEYVKKHGQITSFFSPGENSGLNQDLTEILCRAAPSGWYRLEELNYCRLFEQYLVTGFYPAKKQVVPNQIDANTRDLDRILSRDVGLRRILHHRVAAAILLPALGKVVSRVVRAQVVTDQAAIACALEQCRLAQGQFPKHLDALTPKCLAQLPEDPLAGRPYQYHPTDNGQFVLYSVGWNEKDDGGTPGRQLFDDTQGDWLWEYPAP